MDRPPSRVNRQTPVKVLPSLVPRTWSVNIPYSSIRQMEPAGIENKPLF